MLTVPFFHIEYESTDTTGSRYSDSLRAGRSGDRIPVGARFSAPVQTCPGAHPASCTLRTGSFPGVKRPGRGADHPPPPKRRGHERVGLYLYSPSGPSWSVIGRTFCHLIREDQEVYWFLCVSQRHNVSADTVLLHLCPRLYMDVNCRFRTEVASFMRKEPPRTRSI